MPTEEVTANRGYQLPHPLNELQFDIARLRAAINAIDADVQTALSTVAGNAPTYQDVQLIGTPTAPTPASATNNTRVATTAFVHAVAQQKADTVAASIRNGVAAEFDTLAEIVAQLGNHSHDASAIISGILAVARLPIATQEQALAGILNDVLMTPLRTKQLIDAGRMPGEVIFWPGAAIPSRWMECDGRALARGGPFAPVFGNIGTVHGAGDGSTTFHIPDYRGRVLAGVDGGAGRLTNQPGGVAGTLGSAGGSQTHALSSAQNGVHNHAININDPGHSHDLVATARNLNHDSSWEGTYCLGNGGVLGGHVYTAGTGISATSNNSGSGSPHNNVQPTAVGYWIIYTGVAA
jgi:microcystin-dependent protein